MSDKLERLEAIITKQQEIIRKNLNMVNLQSLEIIELARKVAANTAIIDVFFPVLIKMIPTATPLFERLIAEILKHPQPENCTPDGPVNFLEVQLTNILERIRVNQNNNLTVVQGGLKGKKNG